MADKIANNFPPLKNDLILRVATSKTNSPTKIPIWIMRQAGRYLEDYRKLSQTHGFFKLCQTPELACQVTLLPLKYFDLDAAIIFSDILVLLFPLGLNVSMVQSKGPVVDPRLTSIEQLNFNVDLKQELDYVYKGIHLTRVALEGRVPLIGFSGGPWTLLSYMIEGSPSKTFSEARKWLYQQPESVVRSIFDSLCDVIVEHLSNQVKSGAQILQVFESNCGFLSTDHVEEYLLPALRRINSSLRLRLDEDYVPMIVFAKDANNSTLRWLAYETGYDVIGLSWGVEVDELGDMNGKVLQGNLDPAALYSAGENLEKYVRRMLEKFRGRRYIANLGHGIYPDVPTESVEEFVRVVHDYGI